MKIQLNPKTQNGMQATNTHTQVIHTQNSKHKNKKEPNTKNLQTIQIENKIINQSNQKQQSKAEIILQYLSSNE
jgi:starvation-inducible outer membrane lipoprotein